MAGSQRTYSARNSKTSPQEMVGYGRGARRRPNQARQRAGITTTSAPAWCLAAALRAIDIHRRARSRKLPYLGSWLQLAAADNRARSAKLGQASWRAPVDRVG